ncbi:hypothetical protein JCGZ_18452 [Jatropha curcas]|uniref:Uncharacterized protein n=1 Tax=Jatropha curcas TaxID=180498 RepID=A0A067K170_JATCU|nr:hypothetical protein JCGZ_18452 [Jatropha curcas]
MKKKAVNRDPHRDGNGENFILLMSVTMRIGTKMRLGKAVWGIAQCPLAQHIASPSAPKAPRDLRALSLALVAQCALLTTKSVFNLTLHWLDRVMFVRSCVPMAFLQHLN